jgi:tetratricopeptide (TPR) repeat protein
VTAAIYRRARHTTLCAFAVLAVCAGCAASATERAQSLVREHREGEAVTELRRRLGSHPGDVAARRLLVRVLGFTGDLAGARAESEELARRLGPGDATAHLELGHALELAHRYDEALAEYDAASSAAPASAEGPREAGMRCARWGEVEAARPRLEEAVRRGARDAETWHTLGLVRLHMGDLDAAAEAYRAGVDADPHAAESWLGLATVGVVRGDAQAALEAYDQVLARRPRFAPAELGRAWALAKLGRKSEASRALEHAAELGAPAANVARQRAALAGDDPGANTAQGDGGSR